MDNLGQGLVLSVTGLLITFLALGGLILLIVALEWAFRPRGPAPKAAEPIAEVLAAPAADLGEVAAAIAVALDAVRAESQPDGQLGAALMTGPGRWWRPGEVAEVIGGRTR